MQKYSNNVTNSYGVAVSGASVTVYLTGTTTPATIYSNNSGTVATNPLTTDSLGAFSFYAADGRYDLSISGAGITTQTVTDILLEDPANANPGVFTTLTATGLADISINSSGALSAPTGSVLHLTGADTVAAKTVLDSFGSSASFVIRRSDGTKAAPTNVAGGSGTLLGSLEFSGNSTGGASGFAASTPASVSAKLANSWGVADTSAYLTFSTTRAGSTTPRDTVQIGGVSAVTTLSPGGNPSVGGMIQSGFWDNMWYDATQMATGYATSFWSWPALTGAGAVPTFRNFAALSAQLYNGATLTDNFGYWCGPLTTGTNRYAFYCQQSSGYNFYSSGSAPSYLAGPLQIAGAVATTAGGSTTGLTLGTSGPGVYFGSGAPTISAAQGSLYMRTDGNSTSTRMYVNTNGTTGWTNLVTAA